MQQRTETKAKITWTNWDVGLNIKSSLNRYKCDVLPLLPQIQLLKFSKTKTWLNSYYIDCVFKIIQQNMAR